MRRTQIVPDTSRTGSGSYRMGINVSRVSSGRVNISIQDLWIKWLAVWIGLRWRFGEVCKSGY